MSATEVGALVLFSDEPEELAGFYRALGLPLELEDHGDGRAHFACALGATHFAIFAARGESGATAAPHDVGGGSFFGLTVASVEDALAAARAAGAEVVEPATRRPWGTRALVRDPDGRVVELFERPA